MSYKKVMFFSKLLPAITFINPPLFLKGMAEKEPVKPDINIGLFGHVDHGKTTLTERLTGKWTDTHSEELKRGITIRLGYANSEFRLCEKCSLYTTKKECPKCKGMTRLVRKVSFVDAPGHESLMATMLSGAAIIDGALLLVAANEACPQPQTQEHLIALDIIKVPNIIVVQNKIDLVSEEQALKNYNEIREILKTTRFKDAPIIPISAQHNVNIDLLIRMMIEHIKAPERDISKEPLMFVARSFDINKPGTEIEKTVGGVLGGMLSQGRLVVGDEIEIVPGYMVEEKNQRVWKPLATKVVGIMTGTDRIDEATPGGSIALLTELDPSIVKSDTLTGNVVGIHKKLPPVWNTLVLAVTLLDRVVGAKDKLVVEPLKMGEPLMLNVNSTTTVGIISKMRKKEITFTLKLPVCAMPGSRVTLSRKIGQRWRLIGFGIIS